MTLRIANIMFAPISAVPPDWSKGGATSTTSAPMMFSPRIPRTMRCASRGVRPPISGVPVPGAKAGSRQSTSKVR